MLQKPSLIMVEPTYFSIEYAINPHMLTADGRLKSVDKILAQKQWNELKTKFIEIGVQVNVLPGVRDLPDMVFAANQSFVFTDPANGAVTALLGQMRSPLRRPEVSYFKKWYLERGFKVERLRDSSLSFEGTGDAIIQPNVNVIWGGVGPRTDHEVYAEMEQRWHLRVIPLKLKRPEFYHLDTCFSILDEQTVAVQAEAFDEEGLKNIRSQFARVIEVDIEENLQFFAANCFCPNARDVIIQKGPEKFCEKLSKLGFTVHPVDTGEFIKSGGSVFCMKMAL